MTCWNMENEKLETEKLTNEKPTMGNQENENPK